MAQKVVGYVKLQIPAGKATPAPPVGPALGQHGVNIAAFTKEFNERTKNDMGLIIPVVIISLIAAFSTTADTMSTTIAALCTKGARHDEEPAMWQKIIWGVSIGAIACIMVAFGGGAQGVDGVKYLAACGGAVVLIVFILQVAAAIKVFFLDPETKKDIVDSVDQIEQ